MAILPSKLEAGGLKITGRSVDGALVEMIEVGDHPWFVACQFHPEFTSTPRDGHPLFSGFVNAALAQHADYQAKSGPESFLSFIAYLSISLGVLNLLPIPVLDGGHLPVPPRIYLDAA